MWTKEAGKKSESSASDREQRLDSLGRRIPHKLVQLQSQPHRQTIRKNPPHKRARLKSLPFPRRIIKPRQKQTLPHAFRQPMLRRKLPRKLIIPPRRKHKLHFVLRVQHLKIPYLERVRLAG